MVFYRANIVFGIILFVFGFALAKDKQMDHYDILNQTEVLFERFEAKLKNNRFKYWDKEDILTSKQKEELKKVVSESNLLFFKLREKFRDILFTELGNYPDTNIEAIDTASEMTEWYVNYLEAILSLEDTLKTS